MAMFAAVVCTYIPQAGHWFAKPTARTHSGNGICPDTKHTLQISTPRTQTNQVARHDALTIIEMTMMLSVFLLSSCMWASKKGAGIIVPPATAVPLLLLLPNSLCLKSLRPSSPDPTQQRTEILQRRTSVSQFCTRRSCALSQATGTRESFVVRPVVPHTTRCVSAQTFIFAFRFVSPPLCRGGTSKNTSVVPPSSDTHRASALSAVFTAKLAPAMKKPTAQEVKKNIDSKVRRG